ncbi:MAG: IS1595 family transposase, partial [Chloroflexi bacterium]|nr:IS1595 family transposase [Chloroflexota bacterium]
RVKVAEDTTGATLQGFVRRHAVPGAKVFTDEATAYIGLGRDFDHAAVNHSVGEYVRGMVSTNGMESFWAALRRAYKGVYHKISAKHLGRYVGDFAGRHGIRGLDTLDMMGYLAGGMRGKRLTYRALIADNGLHSGARS